MEPVELLTNVRVKEKGRRDGVGKDEVRTYSDPFPSGQKSMIPHVTPQSLWSAVLLSGEAWPH